MLFLIFLFGIRHYFNSHKDEIFAHIEKTLTEKSNKEIIFDSITMSSLKEFPSIRIKIYNLTLADSLYSEHKRKSVFLEEVSASLSVIDILNEEVKIKSVSAKKGHINIFIDEDQFSNIYVFSANSNKKEKSINLTIIDNDISVLLEDIEFTFIEKIKNKRITAHVNKIDFNIDVDNLLIPNINLDILMKEMGLNLENGTFFNNARCVGSFQPKFDANFNTINVPKFGLEIDKQLFDVSAIINTKSKDFTFLLGLDKVNYNNTNHLLPHNIKSKLEGFTILKPFKVNAKISGRFEYRNNTLVELQFTAKDNEVVYEKDSLHIKNMAFNGSFINRFYNDSSAENRKNYTFSFNNFSGEYHKIPIKITEFYLKNKVSKPLQLALIFEAESEMVFINDLIDSKDYIFSKGTFKLRGNYKGDVISLTENIKSSTFDLSINNLVIKSKDNLSRFNIPIVKLKNEDNNVAIKNLIVDINKEERVYISGTITNFTSLFTTNKNNPPPVSTINFSSDYINFNSLLKLFGAHEKHSESKNLTQVKNSINTLVGKFNPVITFSFQELDFFDVPFSDINIKAFFQKSKINIPNISGSYKNGSAKAKMKIDLTPKKNTNKKEVLKLDLSLNVIGKIEHLAEIFHSENFFFQDADYTLEMVFVDEASSLIELINKSDISLNVSEGSMLYKPENLTLPFNNISFDIKNKNVYLNDFELNLPNNQSFHLKGEVTNFIEIFDKSISNYNITSSITVFSDDIDFSNFNNTFNSTPHKANKANKKNNVKVILNDLYTKFKPTLYLDFEKLSYNNVTLEKVNSLLLFKDKNTLSINNTYCYFYGEKMTLEAEIDISQNEQTHFNTNFSLNDFALENLLYTFHNFGYSKLDKPTELTGIIDLEANFKGIIDDAVGVNYDSLEAELTYTIKNLNLNNFQPIIDAGNKIFRKKRFEEIKFTNINSELSLKNNTITIPNTSVQSTAFDFFIEGILDNSSNTDLWISIPLSNLKRRDLTKAPSKETYKESGKKIYLEIKADKSGNLEHKIYLLNKKFNK